MRKSTGSDTAGDEGRKSGAHMLGEEIRRPEAGAEARAQKSLTFLAISSGKGRAQNGRRMVAAFERWDE